MLSSLRCSLSRMVVSPMAATRSPLVRLYSSEKAESDDEFDNRWVNYFKK